MADTIEKNNMTDLFEFSDGHRHLWTPPW